MDQDTNDNINLSVVKLLGWTVVKNAKTGHDHPSGVGPNHPSYKEFGDKNGYEFLVNSPADYYGMYRKLYSGNAGKYFETESEAWGWLDLWTSFNTNLDAAMELFENTEITVCLGRPEKKFSDEENRYSANLQDLPGGLSDIASLVSHIYSVSNNSWAEAVCMCWLKLKAELES